MRLFLIFPVQLQAWPPVMNLAASWPAMHVISMGIHAIQHEDAGRTGQIMTDAQRRGQDAAWFRPKYKCWIAVPTCPFTFDLFDLRPFAMITGRITFLRPAATGTGRTARSSTGFTDQNVNVTSRSMWEKNGTGTFCC